MIIQSPDIGRKLQRQLRLTELPDSLLAPDVVPVILVEDLSAPLVGTAFGCVGAEIQSSVVGEFPMITLTAFGPYQCTVRRLNLSANTTMILTIAVPTVSLVGMTTSPNTSFNNQGIAGRPASILGTDTKVAIPARRDLYVMRLLANTVWEFEVDIDLAGSNDTPGEVPGSNIMIFSEVANTAISAGVDWVESESLG